MVVALTRDRRAERREAVIAEILEAAWDVARSEGLAGLSLRDVARRIGMRPPSLYWYFDSKRAIYDAMFMQGNRQLLAQLLTNLIENCLKYVPAGGRIEVSVETVADGVRLEVSDNGPGIAASDRARALQPFVRFGSGGQAEGSGLGLSLVAAITRLHRGRLELASNGPGLRVLIDLPGGS